MFLKKYSLVYAMCTLLVISTQHIQTMNITTFDHLPADMITKIGILLFNECIPIPPINIQTEEECTILKNHITNTHGQKNSFNSFKIISKKNYQLLELIYTTFKKEYPWDHINIDPATFFNYYSKNTVFNVFFMSKIINHIPIKNSFFSKYFKNTFPETLTITLRFREAHNDIFIITDIEVQTQNHISPVQNILQNIMQFKQKLSFLALYTSPNTPLDYLWNTVSSSRTNFFIHKNHFQRSTTHRIPFGTYTTYILSQTFSLKINHISFKFFEKCIKNKANDS